MRWASTLKTMLISVPSFLGLRCKPVIATDWIGNFQLSLLSVLALDAIFFVILCRLGAGEDPKQIGFWAEPSAFSVSVGALLFAEDPERVVDRLLKLEAVFVRGAEWTVDGLVQTEGALLNGADMALPEESRSIASIDVPMTLMCSALDGRDFVAVG